MAFAEGSPGEVLAVGELDRCPAGPVPNLPMVKCSLEVDIMIILSGPHQNMAEIAVPWMGRRIDVQRYPGERRVDEDPVG